MRPVLLDLFGGRTGGAARGYQMAGFRVVSIDHALCPENPADVVLCGDVRTLLPIALRRYRPVAAHFSPPCQGRGTLAKGTMPELENRHPNLIPWSQDQARAIGVPCVIENVQSSGVRRDVTLCGEMFSLGVIMHRWFQIEGWPVPDQPSHVRHRGYVRGWRHGVWRDGPYVAAYGDGGGKATVTEMQRAKRIDWSADHLGLRDALPPDYTRWIGMHLIRTLGKASQ